MKRRGLRTVADLADARREEGMVSKMRDMDLPDDLGKVLDNFLALMEMWIALIVPPASVDSVAPPPRPFVL